MGSLAVGALLTSERASEASSSRRDRDVLGATRVGAPRMNELWPPVVRSPRRERPSGEAIATPGPRRLLAREARGRGATGRAARTERTFIR